MNFHDLCGEVFVNRNGTSHGHDWIAAHIKIHENMSMIATAYETGAINQTDLQAGWGGVVKWVRDALLTPAERAAKGQARADKKAAKAAAKEAQANEGEGAGAESSDAIGKSDPEKAELKREIIRLRAELHAANLLLEAEQAKHRKPAVDPVSPAEQAVMENIAAHDEAEPPAMTAEQLRLARECHGNINGRLVTKAVKLVSVARMRGLASQVGSSFDNLMAVASRASDGAA